MVLQKLFLLYSKNNININTFIHFVLFTSNYVFFCRQIKINYTILIKYNNFNYYVVIKTIYINLRDFKLFIMVYVTSLFSNSIIKFLKYLK